MSSKRIVKRAIKATAKENKISKKEARREMQKAITEAWTNADERAKEYIEKYFGPIDKIPSPEEFIEISALMIDKKMQEEAHTIDLDSNKKAP